MAEAVNPYRNIFGNNGVYSGYQVPTEMTAALGTALFLTALTPSGGRSRSIEQEFEARIRAGFSKLPLVPSKYARVTALVADARNIDSQFAILRDPVGLTPVEATLYLSKFSDQESLDASFGKMIDRVRNETDYFRELDSVGISASLTRGLDKGKYGAFVRFVPPTSLLHKPLDYLEARAVYVPSLDVAVVGEETPTPSDIWLSMSTEGILPDSVAALDHELTHDAQWQKYQRVFLLAPSLVRTYVQNEIFKRFGPAAGIAFMLVTQPVLNKMQQLVGNELPLGEAHAFQAAASSPTSLDELFSPDRQKKLFKLISEGYDLDQNEIPRLTKGFELVHKLRLLGLDDTEIGRVVSRARFDEDRGTYLPLEEKIAEECIKWGVEDDKGDKILTDALMARQELKYRVGRHLARKIAAEELVAATN